MRCSVPPTPSAASPDWQSWQARLPLRSRRAGRLRLPGRARRSRPGQPSIEPAVSDVRRSRMGAARGIRTQAAAFETLSCPRRSTVASPRLGTRRMSSSARRSRASTTRSTGVGTQRLSVASRRARVGLPRPTHRAERELAGSERRCPTSSSGRSRPGSFSTRTSRRRSNGFDWNDFGIGAGAGIGLMLLLLGIGAGVWTMRHGQRQVSSI